MALPHAQPDDVINLLPEGDAAPSVSLLRTAHLQIMRLVMPAGHLMPGHQVPGELTIQCLSGRAVIGTALGLRPLAAGQLLALAGSEAHDVKAIEPCVLLVTLLHPTGSEGKR